MKITDIRIKFIPNERPNVFITFDKPTSEADLTYIAAYDKTHKVWVYRGQDGDYIHCGVEVRGKGFGTNRVKMEDGLHTTHPLMPTNSVSVMSLMRMASPVMECLVEPETEGLVYTQGYVDAVAVAKYLYGAYKGETEFPAMACVEWPSGVRVYEPVLVVDNAVVFDARPNRETDKIVFLCTPDDKLTPLLKALNNMKDA